MPASPVFRSPAAETQIVNVAALLACPSPPRAPFRYRPSSLQHNADLSICVPTYDCDGLNSGSSRVFLKPRPAFGKAFTALSYAQERRVEWSGKDSSIDKAIIDSYTPLK
jgi:hypothetical protein